MKWVVVVALAGLGFAAQADEAATPAPASEPAESAGSRAVPPAPRRFETMDRLELDPSAVTGNQELPRVLYIVPWKKPLAGDLPEPPVSSLLDEILAPIDREVFRRQVSYYEQLQPEVN